MTDSELYKELGMLTKDKDRWEESAPFVWKTAAELERDFAIPTAFRAYTKYL